MRCKHDGLRGRSVRPVASLEFLRSARQGTQLTRQSDKLVPVVACISQESALLRAGPLSGYVYRVPARHTPIRLRQLRDANEPRVPSLAAIKSPKPHSCRGDTQRPASHAFFPIQF